MTNDGMTNDELPSGWTRVPFSTVTIDPLQRVPGTKEQIIYIDIGSVDRVTKQVVEPQAMLGKDAPSRARKIVQTGDVLVSTVRPNLNAVALVESQYNGQFASTGFDVLRSPVVDPRWIFYSVRTPEFLDRMSELVQGALYPAVRSFDIRSFVIPIAPLAEQKRIADKLEAVLGRVDACRARLDRVPALLKRFRQSVLAAATSGKLTEEWREENPPDKAEAPLLNIVLKHRDAAWKKSGKKGACPEAPKSAVSELHDLPVGWSWIPLGVTGINPLDTVQTGPFGAQLHKEEFVSKGVPVVAVGNLTGMGFTKMGLYFITEKKASDLSRYDIQAGDVLFARSGATLGKVCVAPPDAKDWRMTGHILRARLNRTYLLPEFCVFALRGDPAVTLQVLGGVQGSTRPGYNTTLLESIQLPVPPLPEQQEIVRRVEDLFAFADRIEARLATAQKTVERLTPATLAKAFRGELVPQDPNDEPASALLDRLRSHPANPSGRTTRKKRE